MARHVSILVTGAPLATRSVDLAAALIRDDWTASIAATEAALPWIDTEQVTTITGGPLRVRYRDPSSPSAKDPDAVIVFPATFNTVAKAALGIADTYVHSVLCEAIGARTPTVMVPMVKHSLWTHPSWASHLERLTAAGVDCVDPRTGADEPSPVYSGTSSEIATSFDSQWVVAALTRQLNL
jgi:phosphopantothenoylcysteine synthetase/decarboxylase